jgi:hypothetical protein
MNDPRFNVTVSITQEDGSLPDPDRFTAAARQAASDRPIDGDLMFAWTVRKAITSMAVAVPDESSAVAVALAVASEALRNPAALPGS